MTDRRGKKGSIGTPDRKPTKAERKEQARLERERIQQQMRSRNRNRTIGGVLVGLAVAAVVVVVFVVQPSQSSDLPSPQSLLSEAAAAAQTASCDAIQETENYDNAPDPDPTIDHVHIGDTSMPSAPPLASYATIPPVSGPHDPTPARAGIYDIPPDIYRAVHSLEHSGVIIWYAPEVADSDEVQLIKDFYSQPDNVGQAKVIVAPYDFPDQGTSGSLPAGVQMALAAWHRLRTCGTPNLAVAFDFSSQFTPTPGRKYVGVAREPNSSM